MLSTMSMAVIMRMVVIGDDDDDDDNGSDVVDNEYEDGGEVDCDPQ